jgi:hypothetical protein
MYYIYMYIYVAAEVMAADYDIVLTTFDVLSKEWAVASPSPGSARWVSIRQHTSAYVSIRQHTSAYVSIRQHTSAYCAQQGVGSCKPVAWLRKVVQANSLTYTDVC